MTIRPDRCQLLIDPTPDRSPKTGMNRWGAAPLDNAAPALGWIRSQLASFAYG